MPLCDKCFVTLIPSQTTAKKKQKNHLPNFLMSSHTIKLIIGAGKAAPTPPVGPALGQKGVKSIDFCKQFNDRTKMFKQGVPISVRITVKADKTFTFITRTPSATWLLKQTAGIEKGSARPNEVKVGTVSLKQIYHIAEIKKNDPAFIDSDLESVAKGIVGSARSLGLEIIP
jgi:large subunit ribosomal protein L11